MKILFLSDNFFPETNAAASRVFERAVHWARWGEEVTVISSFPNFPEGKVYPGYQNTWRRKEEIINGIKVVRVKTYISENKKVLKRVFDFLTYMVSSFIVGLRQPKCDVVVGSSPQFFTLISAYLLSRLKRVPLVIEIADLWPESIKAVGAIKQSWALSMVEKVELFLYRRATVIITLTHSFKENMVGRGIDGSKIYPVLNGVELEKFRKNNPEGSVPPKDVKFTVGYVGTLGMAHNIQNFLESALVLKNLGKTDIKFLIVGSGAQKSELEKFVSKHSLVNVEIVPRVAKDKVPYYLSRCDLALVHLRKSKAFRSVIPSKIFESMAMGVPIVYCGPKSDGSEIVVNAGAGLWVEPEEPKLLAEMILELAGNKQAMVQMSEAGRKAAPRHTRQKQAELFIEILKKTVGHKT